MLRSVGCRILTWGRYCRHRVLEKDSNTNAPIFIVGCGHSGTSLVLAVLGAHSKIHAITYESKVASRGSSRQFRRAMKHFDALALAHDKHRWVEKTPKHIHHVGKILRLCPQAKILLILRDGRDVASSIKERTGSLIRGIRRWVDDCTASEAYWDHPNVHVFKYEDLINDFESTIKEILDFVDEEYEPQIKDFHQIPKRYYSRHLSKPRGSFGNKHKQYRNWQINQPLFDGRGKWKHLSTQEMEMINRMAGNLLEEYGYIENRKKKAI